VPGRERSLDGMAGAASEVSSLFWVVLVLIAGRAWVERRRRSSISLRRASREASSWVSRLTFCLLRDSSQQCALLHGLILLPQGGKEWVIHVPCVDLAVEICQVVFNAEDVAEFGRERPGDGAEEAVSLELS
jgi:hypothetical protein